MARLAPKPSTVSKLLALSGGVCAHPDCGASLVQEGVFNATLAHICAALPNGPRFVSTMTDEERRSFENLMYLCPNHGSLIDKDRLRDTYTIERLRQMKADHERKHIGKRYTPPDEVFDDAIEEARLTVIQNNTINGNRNMQINQQVVFAAGEQVSESAGELLKHLNESLPTAQSEQDTDEEEPPEKPGPPAPAGGGAGPAPGPTAPSDAEVDDQPGTIDSIATAEELTPQWTQTISDINAEIVKVGEYTNESVSILNAQQRRNASASAKIPVFKQLAKRLSDPADKIEDLSMQFALQLKEINPGIRAMIEITTDTAQQDAAHQTTALTLYTSIEELVASSNEGFSSLENMLASMQPVERMSTDLRKPLHKIRQSLQRMLEGRETIESWLVLVTEARARVGHI